MADGEVVGGITPGKCYKLAHQSRIHRVLLPMPVLKE